MVAVGGIRSILRKKSDRKNSRKAVASQIIKAISRRGGSPCPPAVQISEVRNQKTDARRQGSRIAAAVQKK